MGELTNFLGNKTIRIILHYAAETIIEDQAQTPATKLVLVDKLHAENKIYRQGTTILIDTLEEVQAQNEVNNQTIKKYEQEFGVRNEDFIKKYKISVVTSKERNHARTALLNHLKNMNTGLLSDQRSDRSTTVNSPPSVQIPKSNYNN